MDHVGGHIVNRLILFLFRKKFGLKKYQKFEFANQKSKDLYFFDSYNLYKITYHGIMEYSSVSLNWLLDDDCKIKKV